MTSMKNFALLLTSISFLSCSLLDKSADKERIALEREKESQKLQAEVNEALEKLRKDVREIIREEMLPEIQGLSFVPKSIRENQAKAKTSAIGKIVLGRIEWVRIDSNKMDVKARVDSGAQTSSLHAKNITEKVIDGKKYVQFESLDHKGKSHVFIKEVVKRSRVRSSNGEVSKRYVVKFKLSLGKQQHRLNVNLNDRQDLEYNFLIGRNLLMGKYIVDVSQSRLLGR